MSPGELRALAAAQKATIAALEAEKARGFVPEGFVLVPDEPTPEMLEAGDGYQGTPATYRAMIRNAPKACIETEFSQFLSAVMDAAGLVRHGRQSKELSDYLGDMCIKYRTAAPQPSPAPAAPDVAGLLKGASRSLEAGQSQDARQRIELAIAALSTQQQEG
tara:strand:- start:3404 stop:3889 length:486 start_codon:yes stop_codon:yes gene_type:complete